MYFAASSSGYGHQPKSHVAGGNQCGARTWWLAILGCLVVGSAVQWCSFIHPAVASMDVFLARLLRSDTGLSYELGRPTSDDSMSRMSSLQVRAGAGRCLRPLRWKPGVKGRVFLELRRVLGQRARRPASGWRVEIRGGRVHLPHSGDASAWFGCRRRRVGCADWLLS